MFETDWILWTPETLRIPLKFEKWNTEKVEVSTDALQATGTMGPVLSGSTTLFTTSIVDRCTLKINVRRFDERMRNVWGNSGIQFGLVFGDTDVNNSRWLYKNAWCLSTGGDEGNGTSLWCRGKLTETKKRQIRKGSELQMTIDCKKKTVQFAIDQVPFPPIKMDVTDLQIKQLRAAVTIYGESEIEMSEEWIGWTERPKRGICFFHVIQLAFYLLIFI